MQGPSKANSHVDLVGMKSTPGGWTSRVCRKRYAQTSQSPEDAKIDKIRGAGWGDKILGIGSLSIGSKNRRKKGLGAFDLFISTCFSSGADKDAPATNHCLSPPDRSSDISIAPCCAKKQDIATSPEDKAAAFGTHLDLDRNSFKDIVSVCSGPNTSAVCLSSMGALLYVVLQDISFCVCVCVMFGRRRLRQPAEETKNVRFVWAKTQVPCLLWACVRGAWLLPSFCRAHLAA